MTLASTCCGYFAMDSSGDLNWAWVRSTGYMKLALVEDGGACIPIPKMGLLLVEGVSCNGVESMVRGDLLERIPREFFNEIDTISSYVVDPSFI